MSMKKVTIISGSPVKNGNTQLLIKWFAEGISSKESSTNIIHAAKLQTKVNGCSSCRACQSLGDYRCVIEDEVSEVLVMMAESDVIVMVTPLYFFGASAQLKIVFDRMFSLYKFNNDSNSMTSPLSGKLLVLIASAYEDVGLEALEAPFRLTAEYTGMKFKSLLISNAGVSGEIGRVPGIGEKVKAFASTSI
jgi:multimeric flavodoxin WrbA